jgi:archaellum biogenesis ATPase FlaH
VKSDIENKGAECSYSAQITELIPYSANRTKNMESIAEMQDLFTIKSANNYILEAKLKADPKRLFGDFWFENELCILFSDTNLGKSILAVQIAEQIASGKEYLCKMTAEPQKVLYFDFELSDKQFQLRYTDSETNHSYELSDKLFRVELNPACDIPDIPFEKYLLNQIEYTINTIGTRILIIDNLTYLSAEQEQAKTALPLMKALKQLKDKYSLSILTLAHTPKVDLSQPITKNHLAGSKMLINFCDSCFAIGMSSKGINTRYLKQIKVRNCAFQYDTNNILVCEILKHDSFLHFSFVDYDSEQSHLKAKSDQQDNLNEQIIELHESEPDLSFRQIAERLGTNAMKVSRTLKE